jgi:small GTP-binding protein
MSEKDIKRKVIRITMLGDSKVGKSSIINTYFNIEFQAGILPTIGNARTEKRVELGNDKTMKLIIYDAAGKERYISIATSSLKYSQGIIIVFDLTNRQSFANIKFWYKKLSENNCHDIPIVLFGNKCDMKDEIMVTKKEIDNFLCENSNLAYFETSAKDNINIEKGFDLIIKDIFKNYEKTQELELEKEEKIKKQEKHEKHEKIKKKKFLIF